MAQVNKWPEKQTKQKQQGNLEFVKIYIPIIYKCANTSRASSFIPLCPPYFRASIYCMEFPIVQSQTWLCLRQTWSNEIYGSFQGSSQAKLAP